MANTRRHRYVGPADLPAQVDVPTSDEAVSPAVWLARQSPGEPTEPVTFVVTVDGELNLAPRRSEHVALAGGQDVLAAGEITFAVGGTHGASPR